MVQGVEEKLNQLARDMKVYILTADTFSKAASECKGIDAELIILQQPIGTREKEKFIEALGPQNVVAIGNGTNDCQLAGPVSAIRWRFF